MKHTIRPKNAPETYCIEIETKGGSISIKIKDTDKNIVFDRTDMQTGSFSVELTGRSSIEITADHHSGSFSIHPQ